MNYRETYGDLFQDRDPTIFYMQCISSDFACGKGIALKFNECFDIKNTLQNAYPDYVNLYHQQRYKGTCILCNQVFNLITKERYWEKPTYETITNALRQAKFLALQEGVSRIAMPLIGCGLDRLDWRIVSKIISDIFEDTNIEITVYRKQTPNNN